MANADGVEVPLKEFKEEEEELDEESVMVAVSINDILNDKNLREIVELKAQSVLYKVDCVVDGQQAKLLPAVDNKKEQADSNDLEINNGATYKK
jgi:hypothetical protein